MSDWRKELGGILEGRMRASRAEQESARFELFLREVVMPAFKALADELARHQRETVIREAPAAITLLVRHKEQEEILFRLLQRPATNGIVPYVEARLRRGDRNLKQEGFLCDPASQSSLSDVTQEEIIEGFLKYYRMVLDTDPSA